MKRLFSRNGSYGDGNSGVFKLPPTLTGNTPLPVGETRAVQLDRSWRKIKSSIYRVLPLQRQIEILALGIAKWLLTLSAGWLFRHFFGVPHGWGR